MIPHPTAASTGAVKIGKQKRQREMRRYRIG